MIDERLKSAAIARIKRQIPLEEIALDLDIPYMLIKEWAHNMQGNDLVALQANIHAAASFASSQELTETTEQKLENKLQDVALEIATETYKAVSLGDPIFSKSLQLCADTITKLHNTFIAKVGEGGKGETPSTDSVSIFSNMLRD